MLNVSEVNSAPDLDQNHYLNGTGSVVIIPSKSKKTKRKGTLITHIKNHTTPYLILLALAVTILVVYHIEKDYQSTLDQTLAQNKQLKEIIKEAEKANDNKPLKSQSAIFGNVQPKSSQLLTATQSKQAIQPAPHIAQYNKSGNKKANLNPIPYELMPEKFKSNISVQAKAQATKEAGKNTNQVTKTVQNKPNTPQNAPTPAISNKQPPKPPTNAASQAGRPIAGITQDQRVKAQKWLGLKNENIYQNTKLAEEQRKYYQDRYNISSYEELPVCIVIPSHNNVKDDRHFKNIKSVLMQEYTNYHIVFIDDASTDGTGDQIEAFLANQTKVPKQRYVVIKNKEQKRAMPNLRRAAVEFCKPEDIYIIADGDDQLLGRQVLKLYNAIFQKNKAWFVYSNFLSIRGTVGYSRPFPQSTITGNKYRSYPFVTSHLRAFYTQLFINIKEEDLKDDVGEYLKAANDVAICIPILEMSHQRVYYLPELTYYYNSNTGQNNHQVRLKQQKANDRMLRKRKSYARLKDLPFMTQQSKKTTETVQTLLSNQVEKNKMGGQGQAGRNNQ